MRRSRRDNSKRNDQTDRTRALRTLSPDELRRAVGGYGGLAAAPPPKDPPKPPDGSGGYG